MLFVFIYLLACIIVAMMGRKTKAGPVGFFIIALLTTPLLSGFFLLVTRRSETIED